MRVANRSEQGKQLLEKEKSYRGYTHRNTSLIRNCLLLRPYSRNVPRALRWS